MKVYIASDIEGTAGIAQWNEADAAKGGEWYARFARQMTKEAAAACEGALAAGASEVLVKDAHDTARNIDPTALPQGVRLMRGWSGHPLCMVDGLTQDFDAVCFTGFHSPAGSGGNPLSHTMIEPVEALYINGQRASEFTIHSYAAGMLGVPVAFVSGDAELCRQAAALLPGITTVATGEGRGDSVVALHPHEAEAAIRAGVEKALRGGMEGCLVALPPAFEVQVRYHSHTKAYAMAFYPGARQIDSQTIAFEHRDYFEVLRFFAFVLGW